MAEQHPTAEVLIVGIIGSSKQAFSKSWLMNEVTIFNDENCEENERLKNSFCNISVNQDKFKKYDPFEWMRPILKNDKCNEKVMFDIF